MLNYGISSVLWVPFSLKTRLELLHELDRNDKQSTLQVDSCKKRGPGGGGVLYTGYTASPTLPKGLEA